MAGKYYVPILGVVCGLLWLTACKDAVTKQSPPAQKVGVQRLGPLTEPLTTALVGRVYARGGENDKQGTVSRESSYRIRVKLPAGASPTLAPGQSVKVTLPIVHDQETSAVVEAVEQQAVSLLLAKQVQELGGQEVRVAIPLRGKGVFRVPFDAIYSPRGLTTQLFVVQGDHVELRDIKVIALAGPEEVYVTGKLADVDHIVVRGLDNLLTGDVVEVAQAEGDKR